MKYRILTLGLALLTGTFAAVEDAWARDPNPPSLRSDRGAWPIRRQWTMEEAKHFGKWLDHIYMMKTRGTVEQRIAKLERILTDPEMNLLLDPTFAGEGTNPQLPASIMRTMHNILDCAKFTQAMPAYYAYRRALPWMMSYVATSGGDVRTTSYSIPTGTLNSFTSASLSGFFRDMITGFSSGNYRVQIYQRNAQLSDSVPISIDPEYLIPGVVNYTDGHCLLLAQVDKYGELHFLNAGTADTRDIYTYNGLNTVSGIEPRKDGPPEVAYAGCFQGLRAYRFPIAETDGRGKVINVRRRTDAEMKEFGFSTEQYDKMAEMVSSQQIEENGVPLRSFHELIRYRLRSVDKVVPMEFMDEYTDQLADMWTFRDTFVQNAWKDVLANGPITYPENRTNENIFQALGRWETWSSPSSDVDRRNKYFYLADWMDDAIAWFDRMPAYVDLKGLEKYTIKTREDLAKALIEEKRRMFREKFFYYTNSQGQKVRMTLEEAEKRLYDFSFDPNHPPELRWGAKPGSEEYKTAHPGFPTPLPDGTRVPVEESYRLQSYYRTISQREQEVSYLRGMFTEGFPLRYKFDEQLAKWTDYGRPLAGETTVVSQLPDPAPSVSPAVVHAPTAAIATVDSGASQRTEQSRSRPRQERYNPAERGGRRR